MNGKLIVEDDGEQGRLRNWITSAKVGDVITVGDATLTVLPRDMNPAGTNSGRFARLGIDAPSDVIIDRMERVHG